jgi:SNF family Na+-dependent transporter
MIASRYTLLGFVASGVLAGIAAVVLTARTAWSTDDNGTTLLFHALAAVFLRNGIMRRLAKPIVWILVVFLALATVVMLGLPDLNSILRSHQ